MFKNGIIVGLVGFIVLVGGAVLWFFADWFLHGGMG